MLSIPMLVVGIVLFVLGLFLCYSLIRVVADLVIILSVLAGIWVLYEALHRGDISDWGQLILRAPLLGALVALLTAPVLPFTSWFAAREAEIRSRSTTKKS